MTTPLTTERIKELRALASRGKLLLLETQGSSDYYLSALLNELINAAEELARMREALVESYIDELCHALHAGIKEQDGKWWTGGLSEAEWFARIAGVGLLERHHHAELLARIPDLAREMVEKVSALSPTDTKQER